jgi:hypothetical protein
VGDLFHGVFVFGGGSDGGGEFALDEDERTVSAMLILDTELENTSEFPAVRQLLREWAARLWAWLRRQPQPAFEHEEPATGQESRPDLIL